MKNKLRKTLSMPGLLNVLANSLSKIKDSQDRSEISIKDCLLSGYAVFSLKYPSLLQFDNDWREDQGIKHNLHKLYGIKQIPCDTYMRERLDKVDPNALRPAYKKLFAEAQHGQMLKPFEFIDGYYLVALDGTGMFSSNEVHCKNCCIKKHNDGTLTYYHQMLAAVILHPDMPTVIPLAPEPILKEDGAAKNDCERNASKRLISDLRREHSHLKIIITEDGLASNTPHIEHLKAYDMRFILGAKPGDHKWLFDWVKAAKPKEYVKQVGNMRHQFKYVNDASLNDASDLRVNFLEYWEENLKTGKVQHFSWVTDFVLSEDNVYQIMRGGRARWKIESVPQAHKKEVRYALRACA